MTISRLPATPATSRPTGQNALGRVAGFCYDHRRLVLAIWVLTLIGVTLISQAAGSHYSDSFAGGNSQSQQVQNLLQDKFPTQAGSPADVVIHTTGAFNSPASQAATTRMVTALSGLPHVAGVTSPFSAAGAHQVSKDGHIGFAVVQFDEQATSLPNAAINKVITTAKSFDRPGYTVALGGDPISQVVIGLGVGIDYALFIVTRYRQGLYDGKDPRDAVVVSLATSGRAVLFAGSTVVLSLLGLFILNLPFMHGMAATRLITAAGTRRGQPRPGRPYMPRARCAGAA